MATCFAPTLSFFFARQPKLPRPGETVKFVARLTNVAFSVLIDCCKPPQAQRAQRTLNYRWDGNRAISKSLSSISKKVPKEASLRTAVARSGYYPLELLLISYINCSTSTGATCARGSTWHLPLPFRNLALARTPDYLLEKRCSRGGNGWDSVWAIARGFPGAMSSVTQTISRNMMLYTVYVTASLS